MSDFSFIASQALQRYRNQQNGVEDSNEIVQFDQSQQPATTPVSSQQAQTENTEQGLVFTNENQMFQYYGVPQTGNQVNLKDLNDRLDRDNVDENTRYKLQQAWVKNFTNYIKSEQDPNKKAQAEKELSFIKDNILLRENTATAGLGLYGKRANAAGSSANKWVNNKLATVGRVYDKADTDPTIAELEKKYPWAKGKVEDIVYRVSRANAMTAVGDDLADFDNALELADLAVQLKVKRSDLEAIASDFERSADLRRDSRIINERDKDINNLSKYTKEELTKDFHIPEEQLSKFKKVGDDYYLTDTQEVGVKNYEVEYQKDRLVGYRKRQKELADLSLWGGFKLAATGGLNLTDIVEYGGQGLESTIAQLPERAVQLALAVGTRGSSAAQSITAGILWNGLTNNRLDGIEAYQQTIDELAAKKGWDPNLLSADQLYQLEQTAIKNGTLPEAMKEAEFGSIARSAAEIATDGTTTVLADKIRQLGKKNKSAAVKFAAQVLAGVTDAMGEPAGEVNGDAAANIVSQVMKGEEIDIAKAYEGAGNTFLASLFTAENAIQIGNKINAKLREAKTQSEQPQPTDEQGNNPQPTVEPADQGTQPTVDNPQPPTDDQGGSNPQPAPQPTQGNERENIYKRIQQLEAELENETTSPERRAEIQEEIDQTFQDNTDLENPENDLFLNYQAWKQQQGNNPQPTVEPAGQGTQPTDDNPQPPSQGSTDTGMRFDVNKVSDLTIAQINEMAATGGFSPNEVNALKQELQRRQAEGTLNPNNELSSQLANALNWDFGNENRTGNRNGSQNDNGQTNGGGAESTISERPKSGSEVGTGVPPTETETNAAGYSQSNTQSVADTTQQPNNQSQASNATGTNRRTGETDSGSREPRSVGQDGSQQGIQPTQETVGGSTDERVQQRTESDSSGTALDPKSVKSLSDNRLDANINQIYKDITAGKIRRGTSEFNQVSERLRNLLNEKQERGATVNVDRMVSRILGKAQRDTTLTNLVKDSSFKKRVEQMQASIGGVKDNSKAATKALKDKIANFILDTRIWLDTLPGRSINAIRKAKQDLSDRYERFKLEVSVLLDDLQSLIDKPILKVAKWRESISAKLDKVKAAFTDEGLENELGELTGLGRSKNSDQFTDINPAVPNVGVMRGEDLLSQMKEDPLFELVTGSMIGENPYLFNKEQLAILDQARKTKMSDGRTVLEAYIDYRDSTPKVKASKAEQRSREAEQKAKDFDVVQKGIEARKEQEKVKAERDKVAKSSLEKRIADENNKREVEEANRLAAEEQAEYERNARAESEAEYTQSLVDKNNKAKFKQRVSDLKKRVGGDKISKAEVAKVNPFQSVDKMLDLAEMSRRGLVDYSIEEVSVLSGSVANTNKDFDTITENLIQALDEEKTAESVVRQIQNLNPKKQNAKIRASLPKLVSFDHIRDILANVKVLTPETLTAVEQRVKELETENKKLISSFNKPVKQSKPKTEKPQSQKTKELDKPVSEPVKQTNEPKTEPVKPKTEPVKPKTEPVKPKTEPVKQADEPKRSENPFKGKTAKDFKGAVDLTEQLRDSDLPAKQKIAIFNLITANAFGEKGYKSTIVNSLRAEMIGGEGEFLNAKASDFAKLSDLTHSLRLADQRLSPNDWDARDAIREKARAIAEENRARNAAGWSERAVNSAIRKVNNVYMSPSTREKIETGARVERAIKNGAKGKHIQDPVNRGMAAAEEIKLSKEQQEVIDAFDDYLAWGKDLSERLSSRGGLKDVEINNPEVKIAMMIAKKDHSQIRKILTNRDLESVVSFVNDNPITMFTDEGPFSLGVSTRMPMNLVYEWGNDAETLSYGLYALQQLSKNKNFVADQKALIDKADKRLDALANSFDVTVDKAVEEALIDLQTKETVHTQETATNIASTLLAEYAESNDLVKAFEGIIEPQNGKITAEQVAEAALDDGLLYKAKGVASEILNRIRKAIMTALAVITVGYATVPNDALAQQGFSTYTQGVQIQGVSDKASNTINWVVSKGDHNGKNFIVADKDKGQVHLVSPKGEVLSTQSTLFGKAKGNNLSDGNTPSGRFKLKKTDTATLSAGDRKAFGDSVLDLTDPNTGEYVMTGKGVIAMHRVVNTKERNSAMKSADPNDKFLSNGCMNLPVAFYNENVDSLNGAMLYVLDQEGGDQRDKSNRNTANKGSTGGVSYNSNGVKSGGGVSYKSQGVKYSAAKIKETGSGIDTDTIKQTLKKTLGKLADNVTVITREDVGNLAGMHALTQKGIEGFYDPETGGVFIVADNIQAQDGLSANERVAWVAWHELFHNGLDAQHGNDLRFTLDRFSANPIVKQLADAIQKDRLGNSLAEVSDTKAIEEALVELGAAMKTGNFNALETRYGIKLPAAYRNGLVGGMARAWQSIRKIVGRVLGKPMISANNVRKLLEDSIAYAEPTKLDKEVIATILEDFSDPNSAIAQSAMFSLGGKVKDGVTQLKDLFSDDGAAHAGHNPNTDQTKSSKIKTKKRSVLSSLWESIQDSQQAILDLDPEGENGKLSRAVATFSNRVNQMKRPWQRRISDLDAKLVKFANDNKHIFEKLIDRKQADPVLQDVTTALHAVSGGNRNVRENLQKMILGYEVVDANGNKRKVPGLAQRVKQYQDYIANYQALGQQAPGYLSENYNKYSRQLEMLRAAQDKFDDSNSKIMNADERDNNKERKHWHGYNGFSHAEAVEKLKLYASKGLLDNDVVGSLTPKEYEVDVFTGEYDANGDPITTKAKHYEFDPKEMEQTLKGKMVPLIEEYVKLSQDLYNYSVKNVGTLKAGTPISGRWEVSTMGKVEDVYNKHVEEVKLDQNGNPIITRKPNEFEVENKSEIDKILSMREAAEFTSQRMGRAFTGGSAIQNLQWANDLTSQRIATDDIADAMLDVKKVDDKAVKVYKQGDKEYTLVKGIVKEVEKTDRRGNVMYDQNGNPIKELVKVSFADQEVNDALFGDNIYRPQKTKGVGFIRMALSLAGSAIKKWVGFNSFSLTSSTGFALANAYKGLKEKRNQMMAWTKDTPFVKSIKDPAVRAWFDDKTTGVKLAVEFDKFLAGKLVGGKLLVDDALAMEAAAIRFAYKMSFSKDAEFVPPPPPQGVSEGLIMQYERKLDEIYKAGGISSRVEDLLTGTAQTKMRYAMGSNKVTRGLGKAGKGVVVAFEALSIQTMSQELVSTLMMTDFLSDRLGLDRKMAIEANLNFMNFNKRGAGKVAHYLRENTMFANAIAQGSKATFRSLFEQTPDGYKFSLNGGKRFIRGTIKAVVLNSLAMMMSELYDCEEDKIGNSVSNLQPYQLLREIPIKVGCGNSFFRYPVEYGIGMISNAAGVGAMKMLRGEWDFKQFASFMWDAVKDNVIPVSLPPGETEGLLQNVLMYSIYALAPDPFKAPLLAAFDVDQFGNRLSAVNAYAAPVKAYAGKATTDQTYKDMAKYFFDNGYWDMTPEQTRAAVVGPFQGTMQKSLIAMLEEEKGGKLLDAIFGVGSVWRGDKTFASVAYSTAQNKLERYNDLIRLYLRADGGDGGEGVKREKPDDEWLEKRGIKLSDEEKRILEIITTYKDKMKNKRLSQEDKTELNVELINDLRRIEKENAWIKENYNDL